VNSGWMDIMVTVSMLSSYILATWAGHLQKVFHVVAYLEHHQRKTLVFDDTEPSVYDQAPGRFKFYGWSEFYLEAAEGIHSAKHARGAW
jgi:hypothetical protein